VEDPRDDNHKIHEGVETAATDQCPDLKAWPNKEARLHFAVEPLVELVACFTFLDITGNFCRCQPLSSLLLSPSTASGFELIEHVFVEESPSLCFLGKNLNLRPANVSPLVSP
jgi:hypothetical protein